MNSTGATVRSVAIKSRRSLRAALNRLDNEQVRRARGLLKALHSQVPDVLYLGDSELSFVAPGDADRRRLKTMVKDALGPGVRLYVIDGPSFQSDIYNAYLGLLTATQPPPLVIVPLCIRVRFPPWVEHPVHGLKRPTAVIRSIDPHGSAWRVHASFSPPTSSEFAHFHRLPYPNLMAGRTVGDFLVPLRKQKTSGRSDDDFLRLLYAYHHGGILHLASPSMDSVTQMGQKIQQLGCRAVVYQDPVPIEMGVKLFGPDFETRTMENFAVMSEAYRIGAGQDAEILPTGMTFRTNEFLDPMDATEHLNEYGRRRLAAQIVQAVQSKLSNPIG